MTLAGVLALALLIAGSLSAAFGQSVPAPKHAGPPDLYPDATRTPGSVNSDITQENIDQTICNPNWSTKSIRPAPTYTNQLKEQQIREWQLPDHDPAHYEEDHFIALELGGNPTDPKNLWPELYNPKSGAIEKDLVENGLHDEVCGGNITLDRAQRIIVQDWYACYLRIEDHKLCE